MQDEWSRYDTLSYFNVCTKAPGALGRNLTRSADIATTLLIWWCGFHSLLSQNSRFTVRKCRIITVPIYSKTNAMFTTIQCKLHVTNRLGKHLKKQRQCGTAVSDIFLSNVLPQLAKSARARSECARRSAWRTSTPRHKRSLFHEGYRKSFADRCKSRLTSKMSNATLSKHSERRKWRLFTFARFISHRTMNLTFPNAFPGNRVAICRWDRVSTTFLSRVIDDQSFNAVTYIAWRLHSTTTVDECEPCAYEALNYTPCVIKNDPLLNCP